MSHLLEIPDPLYSALQKVADADGMTPIDWIASRLPEALGREERAAAQSRSLQTLADLFAGRTGRIRSGGEEHFSENCGAKLTEYLEEKRKAGHL
ncbi:MAG: hypothetical protein ACRD2L_07725 [Terriglobia bacterium]